MPAPLNSLRSNSTGAFTSHQDTHGFKPFFNGASAKADFLCAWPFAGRMADCLFPEVQLRGSCWGGWRKEACCRSIYIPKKQRIVIAGHDPQSPLREVFEAYGVSVRILMFSFALITEAEEIGRLLRKFCRLLNKNI